MERLGLPRAAVLAPPPTEVGEEASPASRHVKALWLIFSLRAAISAEGTSAPSVPTTAAVRGK